MTWRMLAKCVASVYERSCLRILGPLRSWALHRKILDALPLSAPTWLRHGLWRLSGLIPVVLPDSAPIPPIVLTEMAELSYIEPELSPGSFWNGATIQMSPNHLVQEGEIYYKLLSALSSGEAVAELVFTTEGTEPAPNRIVFHDGNHVMRISAGGISIDVPATLAATFDLDAVAARLLTQRKLHTLVADSPRGQRFLAQFAPLASQIGVKVRHRYSMDGRSGK